MSIVLDGTSGITTNSGTVVSTTDATLNGLTVGKGGGSVARNTAVGVNALISNTTGNYNFAAGSYALATNVSGSSNTGVGDYALNVNTASNNTGVGQFALGSNTSGASNAGVGSGALNNNNTGSFNTALGASALNGNTTASNNTAVGYQAGYTSTTATGNACFGYQSGYSMTTGNTYNTFLGFQSGYSTTGTFNTFVGPAAGTSVTSGNKNTILGGYNGNQGGLDIRTASNYIVLSDGDGNPRFIVSGSGYGGIGTTSSTSGLEIAYEGGQANGQYLYVNAPNASYGGTGVFGVNCARGATTGYALAQFRAAGTINCLIYGNGNIVNTNNSYGVYSDVKLKENIVDATPKLADLMQVKVRNFNFKTDQTHKQIGFIAQELETVFPALVDTVDDKDDEGNELGTTTKSVKTSVLIPILVKSIQELKALVDAQATEIAELKAKVG